MLAHEEIRNLITALGTNIDSDLDLSEAPLQPGYSDD